jgi:ABC-type tungstate transport system substrate-binding protein
MINDKHQTNRQQSTQLLGLFLYLLMRARGAAKCWGTTYYLYTMRELVDQIFMSIPAGPSTLMMNGCVSDGNEWFPLPSRHT